jgi:threonylcarbamoyladenosine tRNA methylthiotransferase MtaB
MLGCRLNKAELESWHIDFTRLGYAVVSDVINADFCIINTCIVTNTAEKKSRKIIRKLVNINPTIKIILTGCLASLKHKLTNKIPKINLIIDNSKKDKLVQLAIKYSKNNIAYKKNNFQFVKKKILVRSFIKIQDGCRYKCSYCIVTIARGKEKSRTIIEIIKSIKYKVSLGVKEIILTGVNLSGYGSDLGTNLITLVKEILSKTKIFRVRFGSIEPWYITTDFLELFENKRMMPHLHLPIQSGSDKILKKMGRLYLSMDFMNIIIKVKKYIPNVNITSDIIVGFPGETNYHFIKTKKLIKKFIFSSIHVFQYSNRVETKAAMLKDHISSKVKKNRSIQLQKLSALAKNVFFKKQINRIEEVLFENNVQGYTSNFVRVNLKNNNLKNITNTIVKVKIIDIDYENQCLFGKII